MATWAEVGVSRGVHRQAETSTCCTDNVAVLYATSVSGNYRTFNQAPERMKICTGSVTTKKMQTPMFGIRGVFVRRRSSREGAVLHSENAADKI